jgi:hypothetical protein
MCGAVARLKIEVEGEMKWCMVIMFFLPRTFFLFGAGLRVVGCHFLRARQLLFFLPSEHWARHFKFPSTQNIIWGDRDLY